MSERELSVPLYLVLILAVWIVAAVGIRHEERRGGGPWDSGIGVILYFAAAVVATLVILLSRAWWGVP